MIAGTTRSMGEFVEHTESRPIFIVGAPRSGTTLCARILGAHSRLFAAGEVHFMEEVHSRRDEFGDLDKPDNRQRLAGRLSTIYAKFNEPEAQRQLDRILGTEANRQALLDKSGSMESAFAAFMQIQAAAAGKQRWINRAPKDIFYIEELRDFFPEGRFICCIRDPMDFLMSYKMKWKATSEKEMQRIKALYHPILSSLLWKASARKVITAMDVLGQTRAHLLRYEDLVTEPEPVVRRLCGFLGENYEAGMCSIDFSNSSFAGDEQGISKRSIGRGRSQLAPEEAWWAQQICDEEMQVFGYSNIDERPTVSGRIRVAATFPFQALRAISANRNKTGPLAPYVYRRLRGLTRNR